MRKLRISLVTVVLALIAIGIVMIYSSTAIYAWEKFGDSAYFLKRQILFVVLGAVLSLCVMSIDYRLLSRYSKILVFLALFLLILLHIPGITREISGAKRWFRLFGFSFQPSEFASLAVIIYTASFLADKGLKRVEYFSFSFMPAMIVLAMVCVLVLAQPDLGTVVALSMVVFIMLFSAGVNFKHIAYVVLAGLPFLYLLIFRVPYRRLRVLSFLNPWADPLGSGFQLIQSQVALGSGGLFGRGLGKSLQKLFYLPAGHTDFIFSVIGEELGFFAVVGIVFLFTLFFIYGCKIIKSAQDAFGIYLSLGIVLLISLKAVINIGVSTAIFPTKGLPLPFISYGGSSLIFDMMSAGLLLNVARFSKNPHET
ncbi:MAG: putative lipid II flippase FtsW [Candidatus Omnitrophota bacterium]